MRILALDTATAATTVALLDRDAGLELEARDDPPLGTRPRHATRLLPLIASLLERAGGGWAAIDRIAVGLGPGTFTGLRIGVATARALAQARGIPLVGVCTLRSLAENACVNGCACDAPEQTVLAVLDARRGEVFTAAWKLCAAGSAATPPTLGEELLAPCALAPGDLPALMAQLGACPLALGPGAVEFRSQLEAAGAWVPAHPSELHTVNSLNHCQLAVGSVAELGGGEILPNYLRLPDAELARRRRATVPTAQVRP